MSIYTTISHETQKVTFVDPSVFKEMVTNEGLSISQMNDQGVRVILFFSTSLSCPYCQGTIDDIYEVKTELAKLNMVPVICHAESNKIWEEFVTLADNNRKFGELLHLDRTKWVHHFKLDSSVMSLVLETLGNGLQELKRLKEKGIKGKLSWFTDETKDLLAAVFVVANSKILTEYRKSAKSERIDLVKLAIDDNYSIAVHSSFYYCDYLKKKELKRLSGKKLDFDRKSSQEEHKFTESIDVKLKDVLDNENYRQYFKMFCMKHFCVEYMIFYEQILKYKTSEENVRKSIGEEMIKNFLLKESPFEIKIKEKTIEEAKEKVKKNDKEAFEELIKELKADILLNVFKEFKLSSSFVSMVMSDKKILNPSPLDENSKRNMSKNTLGSQLK